MRRRRRRGWAARLLRGFCAVLLAIPALALALVWWALPAAREELRLPGLSAPVSVSFDNVGIPSIAAANERDAVMTLGWLHARDRMFQMEVMRRGAEGRLAEILGRPALRGDRFTRLLGLRQRAEADFAALDPEARDLLLAYAEGVNARIASRGRFTAPEFLAIGAPEPWEPVHSLLWGKVMGLWLSGNWRHEIERLGLASTLGAERLHDLWPGDASRGRPDVAAWRDVSSLLAAIPRFPEDAPLPPTASNAWAVMGSRSASGAPLLASDPHLGFQAPVLWYLVRIDLPEGRMRAGASSPGVPLILIGRNERLAWGFTTTHSDTQDVFVERLTPDGRYETEEGPRAFSTRRETIRVRWSEPVVLEVRETRHGPVVSDLEGMPREAGTALAVRMANLEPGDTSAEGLLALNRARSLAEAREAAALISAPPQNLMVAEAVGGIALYLTGRVPIRRAGDGAFPAPGHDGSHGWTGFVPFEALAHREQPESGVLVNANNRVAPADHPVFLGRDWLGDWRFRRIHALLAARERHDPASFAAMQMDEVSLLAEEALPVLRALPRGTGPLGEAQALLERWDGRMAPDRPEPLIWAAFSRQMPALALRPFGVSHEGSPEFLRFLLTDPEAGARWCGGDCRALAALALAEAVGELATRYGASPAAWRWGEAHAARFAHPVLRFVPGLSRLTSLSAPMGGDGETVLRGGFRGSGTQPYGSLHGAGLRFVADLAAPDGAYAVIATGQSGHPLSRHWADLLGVWRQGRLLPLERAAGPPAIRMNP
jgi:penicillin amidase